MKEIVTYQKIVRVLTKIFKWVTGCIGQLKEVKNSWDLTEQNVSLEWQEVA